MTRNFNNTTSDVLKIQSITNNILYICMVTIFQQVKSKIKNELSYVHNLLTQRESGIYNFLNNNFVRK